MAAGPRLPHFSHIGRHQLGEQSTTAVASGYRMVAPVLSLVPLAIVVAALATAARVEPPLRPHTLATRAVTPPNIDGRLDDPVWQTAVVSGGFTQHQPGEGAPPSDPTFVRVVYDDHNLYVGVDCPQVNAPISKRLQRRDGPLPSDGVWIDIDSRDDGVTAFHFSINAAGALMDGVHFNDTDFSSDWDGIWEAKVAEIGHGYSVEFRIPLATLRFTARPTTSWGFQVRRFIDARQEYDDWAFYPRDAASVVPWFGRLDGLVGLPAPGLLEVTPFALGRIEHRAPGVQEVVSKGWFLGGSAGLDAQAHLTNELTLTMTVNPDFGQVEADAVILNLSTFETFFPERRPFFLEALDAFATIRPLVYSRRIGRQPAAPSVMSGEALVALPDPSRIWGAAKMSGTFNGRTTVGAMSAITGENAVEVQSTDGSRTLRLAEPVTAYNVLRLKRLVADNADVGLLATATNRFDRSVVAGQRCAASLQAPVGARCTNDAYVLSLDGRWRSGLGDYSAAWQIIGGMLSGGEQRSEPDGIAIQPGHPDGGASVYIGKEGGPHWLWSAWQHLTGRQLEFNDLGYLERKNDYQGYFTLTYRTLSPWRRTRETRSSLQLNIRQTLDGLNLWRELMANTTLTFTNFWTLAFEVHGRADYYDDREMGDGAALERPGNVGVYLIVVTDPRRRAIGTVIGDFDRHRDGNHLDVQGQLTLRLLPQLEISMTPTVSYDSGAPRYVGPAPTLSPITGVAYYTFGLQLAVTAGATIRAAYTFTPQLSLQVYAQLFLAKVNYGPFYVFPKQSFRERVDIGSLLPAAPPSASPDTNQATLNVNVVLRWEYRLGSTLFLVYTRAQTPATTVPANGNRELELAPIWQGRAADDVLIIKLAYWLG